MPSPPPELPHRNEGVAGRWHCAPPPPVRLPSLPPPLPRNRRPRPRIRRGGGSGAAPPPPCPRTVPVVLCCGGLIHGPPAQHGPQVNDQCRWMQGAVPPCGGVAGGGGAG